MSIAPIFFIATTRMRMEYHLHHFAIHRGVERERERLRGHGGGVCVRECKIERECVCERS